MQIYTVKINIKSSKEKLTNILQNYYLHNINGMFDKNDSNEKQRIIQQIKKSNLAIIDHFAYKNNNDTYLIIGFNETIIIIQDSSIKLLQPLFTNNIELKFCFLHNSKDIFDKNNDISKDRLFQYSDEFNKEIANFNEILKIDHPRCDQIFQMQNPIKSCISGYLIGESYFKLIEEQKIDFLTAFNKEFNQKEGEKSNINEWTEDDYIELRIIGNGSIFITELIYEIETGHLFAAKKANSIDREIPKLNTREYENYLAINYPLIPKFYGKQKTDNFLIIQYIHGQTLNNIDIEKLTLEYKISIMIELMLIIQYLHDNKFVYRDLKPNNVIIDENKTVFLIDFDRMIKLNSTQIEIESFTIDFSSDFVAPEVNNGNISFKNDIYSLGMMMKYLQLEKENGKINKLYQNCKSYSENQRPSIFELISQFYSIFIQDINKTLNVYFPEIQYLRGKNYYEGKYIERNIDKSIDYLTLSANQNNSNAQYYLGLIYYLNQYISRDINKSLYYLILSANQNNSNAQHLLCEIYHLIFSSNNNNFGHKKPWEIEDIQIEIDYKAEFLSKFIIYDDSKLIQSDIFRIEKTDDFIHEINDSEINTGIMISNMKINGLLIYLFIMDNRIFILKQTNLPKFQKYFNEHLNSLIFMTSECEEDFIKSILSKDQNSKQRDQIINEQIEINEVFLKEIIRITIKKSQYRTIKIHQEILPNKFNSNNYNNYKLDDFIQIQYHGFKLCYNSKDQILNVLKFYDDERRFNHEIDFYHQIENTFPFIRKIFGIIKHPDELPIIILEYIEGETLYRFILNGKEINFNTKVKIILEILLSIYYIHSNGFFLRDLKPDNIIINSENDAILIDFDASKEIYSPNKESGNTGDIGNIIFVAPEQNNSNKYTYKVDSYSIGMIIHFIITRKEYDFNYYDLSAIYERKENISKYYKFPKLPHEYEFFLHIYEKCFEISPNSRPFINSLIGNIIAYNKKLKIVNETEIHHILNQLIKYESKFKIADADQLINCFISDSNLDTIMSWNNLKILFCIFIVKKYNKITFDIIKKEIASYQNIEHSKIIQFASDAYQYIKINNLEDFYNLENELKKYKKNIIKIIQFEKDPLK